MSDTPAAQEPLDTTPLRRLVASTRRLLRSSWVAIGLGLTVGLLIGTLVVLALVDLVWPLASWLRMAALLAVAVPPTVVFFQGVVRPLFRRLTAPHVARRIEQHIPGIHNRLVSCIDLESNEAARKQSAVFYRRLVTEALARIRGFRPSMVVDFVTLRKSGTFALISCVAFLVAFALFSDRLPTAMARIFAPFADIPPATGVRYRVEPADARVLRGDDINFAAVVDKGEPDKLTLELDSPLSKEKPRYDLKKLDNGRWTLTLSSVLPTGFENGFTYRVYGGGTWSKQHHITLVERPKIVDLHTVLHYPEYMAISEPRIGPPQVAEVAGPESSTVEVVVQAEGDVASGEVQFVEGKPVEVEVKDRIERSWFEDKLPQGAKGEGSWSWSARDKKPVHASGSPSDDVYSHWFTDAALGFEVRPGENLFTWVYIPADKAPRSIMLKWHDGTGWEHRALWGADSVREGQKDTAGHRVVGPMPAAGQWVRLEVPATAVGLEGRSLRGMSFTLDGGQVQFGKSGAMPPTHVTQIEYQPIARFPMTNSGEHTWSGRFPLTGTGLYRVELKNDAGFANKTMKEERYMATPDLPPHHVRAERPGADITVSTPDIKVPLIVEAKDDYGLASVKMLMRRGDSKEVETVDIRAYPTPVREDTIVTDMDLIALHLKLNDTIHYKLVAADRKGQTKETQEYTLRIAVDPNAADQQLAALDKTEDPFKAKLAQLIADQAKVKEAVDKLETKYADTIEKVRKAQDEQRAAAPMGAPNVADPKALPDLKLDPETQKKLDEMRRELAELTRQEQKNVELGKQVDQELAKMADASSKTALLPQKIVDETKDLRDQFQKDALKGLQDLASRLDRGADAKQSPANSSDLKNLQDRARRSEEELNAIKEKAQAIADARNALTKDGADKALAKLDDETLKQNLERMKRDLEALKNHLGDQKGQFKNLKDKEDKLADATEKKQDPLADLLKKQDNIELDMEKLVARAKELQEKARKKKRPDVPDAPYDPEAKEEMVPPKEEDTPDPDDKTNKEKKLRDPAAERKAHEKKEKEEDEKFLTPSFQEKQDKLDPRFKDKERPTKKKKPDSNDPDRDKLEDREENTRQGLEKAIESTEEDEKSVDKILDKLKAMLNSPKGGKSKNGKPNESKSESDELANLLKDPSLQEALAMAQKMSRQSGKPQTPSKPNPNSTESANNPPPNQKGPVESSDLEKLEAARAVLLKLQPKDREQVIQGKRNEPPRGYSKHVIEYNKYLNDLSGNK